MNHLIHEKIIYRYISALEQGDFETLTTILQQAEQDPELETMLWEVSEHYGNEYEQIAQTNSINIVEQLIEEHLPSAVQANTEEDLPPLTIGDVMARLQSTATTPNNVRREASDLAERISHKNVPLPAKLNRQSLSQVFEQLELSVSKSFQTLFHKTAIFLSMGREQNMARLAATRRQQQLAEPKPSYDENKEEGEE